MKEIEVQLCEWFDEHWYKMTLEDKTDYFPSITTKLGAVSNPGLIRYYKQTDLQTIEHKLFLSSKRGIRIHNAEHVLASGGVVVYMPFDPKIVCSEQIVYSIKYREAGTMDREKKKKKGAYEGITRKPLKLEDGIYLADTKTGMLGSAYKQGAGYMNCAIEMGIFKQEEVKGFLVEHTGSDTKTGIPGFSLLVRTMEELREDYKDYRAIAGAWEVQNKTTAPRLFEFPSIIKREQ